MLFAAVVLLAAVGIGAAAGGSLSRLGDLALRHGRLVVIALALQLLGTALSQDDSALGRVAYPLGLATSAAIVAVFLGLNRGVRGTGLVALGLLSNALVVGLNGAMPVSADASGRAGITTQELLAGTDPRHELAGPGTRLEPLADVVPVLLPGHHEVVSVGDVLVAAGLAQLVVVGMTAGVASRTVRRRTTPGVGVQRERVPATPRIPRRIPRRSAAGPPGRS